MPWRYREAMARWAPLGSMSRVGAVALLTMVTLLTAGAVGVAVLAATGDDGRSEIRVAAPPTSTSGLAATTPDDTQPNDTAPDNTAPGDTGPSGAAPGPIELVGHHVPYVIAAYPHDPTAWTQGLEWYEGSLLESTGLVGESSLRLVDPETGTPTVLVPAPDALYAEGVTVVDGEAIQLTYQDRALLRTPLPLEEDGAATTVRVDDAYGGEGWGLCFDGEHLVMSNGSDELVFRDPATFEIDRSVVVTNGDETIDYVNELECVGDQILANVWQTSSIIAIDPATGIVEGSVDASDLVPVEYRGDTGAVLNGIAYNPATDTYWVTGKLWPVIYEVRFVPV